MKFNRAEMAALASQPTHRFDREGVMFVREKQEGFFRRAEKKKVGRSLSCVGGAVSGVCVERWCRLRGNLLFYFKSRDQWSEPAGIIVLENFSVEIEKDGLSDWYGLVLIFEGGQTQYLGCATLQDRSAWHQAIIKASHKNIKHKCKELELQLHEMLKTSLGLQQANNITANIPEIIPTVIDPDIAPELECSFTCDNLICDAIGRSPSVRLAIYARNSPLQPWRLYANTETVERTSNPVFLVTVQLRAQDGYSDRTQVKVVAQDTRERFSMIRTCLGEAFTHLKELKQTDRLRLKLEPPHKMDSRGAGFVTIHSRTLDSEAPRSTESTPVHQVGPPGLPLGAATPALPGSSLAARQISSGSKSSGFHQHKRSHSLPGSVSFRMKLPQHLNLLLLNANPCVKTYRFHSGLGGDISAMELMAEPKLTFAFPQQLLSLWIAEEKELVHEIAGLGELKEPCHRNQMMWLENHLNLINIYSTAMENMENLKGTCLKKSVDKGEKVLEFVPTNLHLQRLWVESSSLRKMEYYDIHTVGAFTAFAQKSKSEGLMRMLKELKSPQKNSTAWCTLSDQLQLAEDTLAAVRRVRREVVDCMRLLMKLAKEKQGSGMFHLVESMLKKTKVLCSISDTVLVEQCFAFLETNRVTVRPEKDEFSDSVAEFMHRNKLKIDLQFRPTFGSLQTPNTEFISKELRTPDPEFFSPSGDPTRSDYWRGYSAFTSGYQSVDRLSDIDEFEESFRYMSIEDKTRHYYTLCRDATPHSTPNPTPTQGTPVHAASAHNSADNSERVIPVEVAKSETIFSENDSALDDEDKTDTSSHQLSDDEGENQDYDFDENVYHNDDEEEGDIPSEDDINNELNKQDEDQEDSENIEEDESTPHAAEDLSKTQSPCSTTKSRILSFEDGGETIPGEPTINQEDDIIIVTEVDNNIVDNKSTEIKSNPVESNEVEQAKEAGIDVDQTNDGDNNSENIITVGNGKADAENGDQKVDNGITSDNEASSHYRSGDEPEPIDLTHLNVEASMMSLASKIRVLCGKANSPTLSNRTFRFRELDSMKKNGLASIAESKGDSTPQDNATYNKQCDNTCSNINSADKQSGLEPASSTPESDSNVDSGFKIPDVPKPSPNEEIEDWAGEVRPSMRKLRQGMDSLLKTSRLVCSVLRLKQAKEAVNLTHEIKYRRDVCFSQALTSLVSALMSRLWCRAPDTHFIRMLIELGPLVYFEGLLSLHGEDVTILNDMIVAVEDLRSVEFTLVLVERRAKGKQSSSKKIGHMTSSNTCTSNQCNAASCAQNGGNPCSHAHMPLISVSSFPLPRVTGSRNSLKVLLPVPDWVYTQIPILQVKNMRFTITPVLFNVGINEKATIAEKLGNTAPQDRNNSDNFRILTDYIRRYKRFKATYEVETKTRRGSRVGENHHLEDLVSILRNEVNSHKGKNVDILNLVAQISYILGGIRMTSCKSAKDRTSMGVTLEQVNLLSREFDLADTEYQRALDTMRSEGVRRINCEKNTGQTKYAFNSLQLTTFPSGYRPPVGTFGSTLT